jgi:hypothetical protein
MNDLGVADSLLNDALNDDDDEAILSLMIAQQRQSIGTVSN